MTTKVKNTVVSNTVISDVNTGVTVTKARIYNVVKNIRLLRDLLGERLGIKSVHDGLVFECVQQARQDFDYDTDSGKETSAVYKVTNPQEPFNPVYIKLTGVYQSYDGVNLCYWDFVVPKEVTKVEYVQGE